MAARNIVWLHLSDLHACKAKTGWDAHQVLDTLIPDLQAMEEQHGLSPNLIFFTGDAAFGALPNSPLPEQYAEVALFLESVRSAFKQPIPKDNIFLVPGNHDVDRAEVTPDQTAWLTDPKRTADEMTALIQGGGKQWQNYMERLKAYREFLEREGYQHLLADAKRLIYTQTRAIHGVNLGIAGFNSAWSCGQNGERGRLWLGGDWQCGTLTQALKKDKADIRIGLIHHPYGWFVEQEDPKLRLQIEREFHFFLHGHEHLGWVDHKVEGHVRVAAAACYEHSDQQNGYNFARLNLDSGQGEIWLRKYDAEGGGWTPRLVAGKTNNSGLWLLNQMRYLKEQYSKTSFNQHDCLSSIKQLSGRFVCQKITEGGLINLSSVSYPYTLAHDPTEFDDMISVAQNIFCTLWLPSTQYIKSPLQNFTCVVATCFENPKDIVKVIYENMREETFNNMMRLQHTKLRNEEKEEIFRAIGKAFSTSFVIAASLPKAMLQVGRENPIVAYTTVLDILLLPTLQMNERFNIKHIDVTMPKIGDASSKLLSMAKRITKAVYNKKGSYSVGFYNDLDESTVIGQACKLIAWAVNVAHNSGSTKWIMELNSGLDGMDYSRLE
jgi:hypothetical protein